MKRYLPILAMLALLVSAQPAFALSTGTQVSGSSEVNAYPDSVLTYLIGYSDYTAEAADSTADDIGVGSLPTVYIGSNSAFDQILFDITTAGSSTRSTMSCPMFVECHHFDLEYYNGLTATWDALTYTDNTGSFQIAGANTWEFDLPDAWDDDSNTKETIEGETLYWVRITLNSNTSSASTAYVGEIALRSYNVEMTVENELGSSIDSLVSEDFSISGGTSNSLAGWRDMGSGVYQLALDADLTDSNYNISAGESGYVDSSTDSGVLSTIQKALSLTMDYTHRINVTNESGAALTPSAVSIDGNACTLSGTSAYCAVSTSTDGTSGSVADVTVTASGYETKTQELSGQRDSNSDAQVVTTVALSAISCDVPFVDIYGHWAEGYIDELFCNGAVNGRDATHYVPNDNVTRAEFLKIALLNAGFTVDGSTGADFSDVDSGDWFYEYVSYGADEGYIEGYDDGTFLPNASINRAEALVILMRIAGESSSSVSSTWAEFSDVDSTDWFAYAVKIAADEGIVEGYDDGSFRPGHDITRAEVAAMAVRTYDTYYAP